jgi:hypothetical protein
MEKLTPHHNRFTLLPHTPLAQKNDEDRVFQLLPRHNRIDCIKHKLTAYTVCLCGKEAVEYESQGKRSSRDAGMRLGCPKIKVWLATRKPV